jgi:hypothetical protein
MSMDFNDATTTLKHKSAMDTMFRKIEVAAQPSPVRT